MTTNGHVDPAVRRRGPGRWAGAARRPLNLAAAGRISWGLTDQAISSLTNVAVGATVARGLGPAAFGAFSVAWVTYAVLLNASRGLATDPLVVRFNASPTPVWRGAVRQASGTALSLGALTGAVSVLFGWLIGGSVGSAFVALGVGLPVLLLQDSWRVAFFAAGQAHKAVVNDLVWAAALVPTMIIALEHHTVAGYMIAWWSAAALAAVVGAFQVRALPRPGAARRWWFAHRDLSARYAVENLTNATSGQVRIYALGAIAGLASVGAVRGAALLLGPFLALLIGLSLVAVPEGARALRRSTARLHRFCVTLGAVQAVAAVCWGFALLVVLPDPVGRFALGDVWEPASALIMPVTIEVMAAAIASSASVGLRALGAAKRGLRAQLLASALYLVGGISGAVIAGAAGSAWGVAIGVTLSNGLWWLELRRALRDRAAVETDARPPEPAAAGGAATGSSRNHETRMG